MSAQHDWRPTTFIVYGQHHQGFKCHACHKPARCPHGCGLLDWVIDQWYCPKCGDEWHDAETFGTCGPSTVVGDQSRKCLIYKGFRAVSEMPEA